LGRTAPVLYISAMVLHFAYGSNMSRPHMRVRCPDARAIGTVTLADWRFVICPDGFASLVRRPGCRVHGVLWRLSARDVAAINAYENVAGGLYVRRRLRVRSGQQAVPHEWERVLRQRGDASEKSNPSLVYIARRQGTGVPRPDYIDLVVQAARDWRLPPAYIRSIARWAPGRWRGARAKETGEVR
jgi:hypothetical protein